METFTISRGDRKFEIDADTRAEAIRMLDAHLNPPPPGVMIHEPGMSYIAGNPDAPTAGYAPPYVDTRGMAPGVGAVPPPGSPAPGAQAFQEALAKIPPTGFEAEGIVPPPAAGMPSREEAAAALALRQKGGSGAVIPRVLQPFAQGYTASYGDEAASLGAGAGAMLRGGEFAPAYDMAQEAQRQDLAQMRQEMPLTSAGLQAGGALLSLPSIGRIPYAGRALTGATTPGASLAARVGAGGGAGALYGGIEGFGSGSGIAERGQNAALGSAIGGGLGAALPLAGEGLRAGTRSGLDYLRITNPLASLGLGLPAGRAAIRSLEGDEAFGGGLGAQNIGRAGPDAMLVDAGPASVANLDAAMRSGPEAGLVAGNAIKARGAEAETGLRTALDQSFGPPRGLETMVTGIREGSAPARHATYTAAYSKPIDYASQAGQQLEALLKRFPKGAIEHANEEMRTAGHASRQIKADIADDGTITFSRMPDVEQIDYMTRGLKTLSKREGALGGKTDTDFRRSGLIKEVRDLLGGSRPSPGANRAGGLVPEYGTALDTAAHAINEKEATEFGYDLLRPGTKRDTVANEVTSMSSSAAELRAARQGVRSYVDDLMANVKGNAANTDPEASKQAIAALKELRTDAAKEKLAVLLDPVQLASLDKEIARAAAGAELAAKLAPNSATMGRGAQREAVRTLSEPGLIEGMKRGSGFPTWYRNFTQHIFGRKPSDMLAQEDEINRQIAEILTARHGTNVLDTLEGVYRAGPANIAIAGRVGAIPNTLRPGLYAAEEAERRRRRGR